MPDKKPAYSTWQNTCYVIKNAWQIDKLVFLYFGANTILTALQPFIGIFFPRWILAELLGAKRPEQLLMMLVGFFVTAAVTGYGIAWLSGAYFPRLVSIRLVFIRRLQEKCMTTDFANTENPEFLNDMMTGWRCLQTNDRGIEGMMHKLFGLVGGLLALLMYVAIVSTLNIWVLLYLLLNVGISYLLTFSAKRYEHSQKDKISDDDRRAEYINRMMNDFTYDKELRLFGIRGWVSDLFMKFRNSRLDTHKRIQWRHFRAGLFEAVMLLVREGIIYAYLIYMVISGQMDIPSFTMYFATIAAFALWLNTMIKDLAFLRAQNLDICDYRAFVERGESMTSGKLSLPKPPYLFEFRNVSFKYPNTENYIFENLNLTIPYGQKLAIVGTNGAGKTTLVKLLARLYDVSDGEILLNGVNIKEYDRMAYYAMIAPVFQEITAFAFPVAENVSIAEGSSIDRSRVQNALEQAGVWGKITTLKKGMDTSMLKHLDEEGIQFSGGENQKISIARALYKNGAVLMLDEPTAALDAIAEREVYERFGTITDGKTVIYVSHRLASTNFCDAIAMLDKGKLVEYGTHNELLAKNGKYAEMFAVQAQYCLEGGEENETA